MKWFSFVLMCSSFALYSGAKDRQETQLRIQPVGEVSVQSQSSSKFKSVQLVVKKESGKKIYIHYCGMCHKKGLAGAPKFRNKYDWKPRLAEKTFNDLFSSLIKGLNAMPEKGACLKCSNEELKAALSYMLPQS